MIERRSWDIIFEPKVNWDAELTHLLVEIESYKLSTQRLPLPPKLRARLDKLNIVRAIRGTTAIEGNMLSEEEISAVLESLKNPQPQRSQEEQEVLNAWDVLSYIESHKPEDGKCAITEDIIRNIHELTTKDIVYESNRLGEYRTHGAVAGEYIAPEPNQIPELMRQFVEFINSPFAMRDCPTVIRAIMAHFYLVSVHPFGDGNGRTSRGVEAFILFDGGYNVAGFYSLANFYYRNRAQYVEELQAARFRYNGNLTEFIKFSLRGFASELRSVQDEILAFIKRTLFKDLAQERFEIRDISKRQYNLLRFLLEEKDMGIAIRDLTERTHPIANLWDRRSKATIYSDIRKLREEELLVQKNDRLQINLELMDRFTFASQLFRY